MSIAMIYLRVSTEEQAEKGFSIYAQREECTKKAQELGCTEVLEYLDDGVSGSILERPMLMNALDDMKNKKVDFFICYDSSRLSRNVSHQLILVDSIKKHGAKLVFIRNSFEDTAEGRFQITIMAAVDEYERAKLKVRTELGKRAKAKQGKLTHNPSIYGYYFNKETDELTINDEQASIIKMMYNWLLEEKIGPAAIAEKLNKMNVPSMRGKKWSRVTVNRMLNNFSYTGTLYIRRYDTREYRLNKYKIKDERVSIKQKPKEQWVPITIPQIIDIDTWRKASFQLAKSKRIYKRSMKEQYLLSGLLKCGICGGTIFGRSTYKGGQLKNKYYCCINKYNYNITIEERCKSKLIKADELEQLIWGTVKAWILNEKKISEVIQRKQASKSIDKENAAYQLINKAETEKQKIITLFFKNLIEEQEMENRLKAITETIDILRKEYESIKKVQKSEAKMNESGIVSRISTYLETLDVLDKNKLLHIIIKEIILEDNKLIIKIYIPSYLTNDSLE